MTTDIKTPMASNAGDAKQAKADAEFIVLFLFKTDELKPYHPLVRKLSSNILAERIKFMNRLDPQWHLNNTKPLRPESCPYFMYQPSMDKCPACHMDLWVGVIVCGGSSIRLFSNVRVGAGMEFECMACAKLCGCLNRLGVTYCEDHLKTCVGCQGAKCVKHEYDPKRYYIQSDRKLNSDPLCLECHQTVRLGQALLKLVKTSDSTKLTFGEFFAQLVKSIGDHDH